MNGCIGENAAHDFTGLSELSTEHQKRLGRTDIVAWAWCKHCGSLLEIYAGAQEPPIIIPPRYKIG